MNLVTKLTRRSAADLRIEIERNTAALAGAEMAVAAATTNLDEAVTVGAGEDAAERALADARATLERHRARAESLQRAIAAAEQREAAARLDALLAEAHAVTAEQAEARSAYDRSAASTAKALGRWEGADQKLHRLNREIEALGGEPVGGPYSTHVRDGICLPAGVWDRPPHQPASPQPDGRIVALAQLAREARDDGERKLEALRSAAMGMLRAEWTSTK